jgi:hypothetical protein
MLANFPTDPGWGGLFSRHVNISSESSLANESLRAASDDGKFITGVNMEVDGGRGV